MNGDPENSGRLGTRNKTRTFYQLTIPQLHELSFDHGGGFVILLCSHSQETVNLVNEDDAGLDLPRQCEDCSGELLTLSIPLVCQTGDVQVDESETW